MVAPVEAQLRRFQLALAAAVCAGIIAELVLIGHTEGLVQLVPIVLPSVALLALGLAYARPSRTTVLTLRAVMVILMAAGAFGIYEHFEHNLAFELEIQPNATFRDVWLQAMQGASPFLAPGAVALAGLLGLSATYRHPEVRASA